MSIQQHHPDFAASLARAIETLGGQAEELAAAVDSAAALITDQLVAGHKVVVLATPAVAPLGGMFCHEMLFGSPELRPALPAIALPPTEIQPAVQGSARREADRQSAAPALRQFLRAAEAVSGAGDTLLVLCETADDGLPAALDQLYLNREVCSVLLTPATPGMASNGQANTVVIAPECDTVAAVQQITLFILNALADMIETRVFGSAGGH